MQLIETPLDGPGEIQVAIKDAWKMKRAVSATLKSSQSSRECLRRDRPGGRDYADGITRAQSCRQDTFLLYWRSHQERSS
jgi:hypothetical protein